MERSVDNVCAVCPLPGNLCVGCSDIHYCGRSHRLDDLPNHKLICQKFGLLERGPYPGKVLALLFPVNGTEPEFTRLAGQRKWPQWNGIILSKKSCLRVNGCSSTCSCDYNTYDSRFTDTSLHTPLCQYIHISAPEQEDMPSANLEVNRCIETLTGDTSWRGPVIAFVKNAKDRPVDMGTSVFNKILSAFRGVRGVRINCDGVVKERHAPRFEAVTIKSYDLRGTMEDAPWRQPGDRNATFLTQHTGIVLQDKPESYTGNPDLSGLDQNNPIARLLSIPCDTDKQVFGHHIQNTNTGNVIVVREDRKPLDVQYVETMCHWLNNVLLPLFKQARTTCKRVDRGRLPHVTDRPSYKRAVRENVFRLITEQNLLAYSDARLRDEDTEDREDGEMADIIDNEVTTTDELHSDSKDTTVSDNDNNNGNEIPGNEINDVQESDVEE